MHAILIFLIALTIIAVYVAGFSWMLAYVAGLRSEDYADDIPVLEQQKLEEEIERELSDTLRSRQ